MCVNFAEFTFDVDVSKLPCGLNGALYFVQVPHHCDSNIPHHVHYPCYLAYLPAHSTQMDADGGKSKHAANKGGAKYGTGYCDAQVRFRCAYLSQDQCQ